MKKYKVEIVYLNLCVYVWEGKAKDELDAQDQAWCDFKQSSTTTVKEGK